MKPNSESIHDHDRDFTNVVLFDAATYLNDDAAIAECMTFSDSDAED